MTFGDLLGSMLSETLRLSLPLYLPELLLCASVVLLLLARVAGIDGRVRPHWIALVGIALACAAAWIQFGHSSGPDAPATPYFGGMLVMNSLVAFGRLLLLLFLALWAVLTMFSGLPDHDDAPDFYILAISGTIGMLTMIGADHLLMIYFGIEMASVPSYMLAGFLKGRRQGSEAALKFVVYGAGAAGVLLYGASLLAGLQGTPSLRALSEMLTQLAPSAPAASGGLTPTRELIYLALVMVGAGLAFKLSLVPFHFWAPDAFEGSASEVGAYLAVASKSAAAVLLLRFVEELAPAATSPAEVVPALAENAHRVAAWSDPRMVFALGLGVAASISMLYGTLAAYGQQNLKRLLAYSSIAHAGFLALPISAVGALQASFPNDPFVAGRAVEAVLVYIAALLPMNLGAFAAVALVRNALFSEDLSDYRGLARRSPLLGATLGFCLFGLIGLPPFLGFFAKWQMFVAAYDAARLAHPLFYGFIGVALLATVLSLYYYMNVLRVMVFEEPLPATERFALSGWQRLYLLLVGGSVLAVGLLPGSFLRLAHDVAWTFLRQTLE